MDVSHLYNDAFFGSLTTALDVKEKMRTQEINTREEKNLEKWTKIFQRGQDICERDTTWEKWKVYQALYSIWERTPRLEKSLAAEKARVESLHQSLLARTNPKKVYHARHISPNISPQSPQMLSAVPMCTQKDRRHVHRKDRQCKKHKDKTKLLNTELPLNIHLNKQADFVRRSQHVVRSLARLNWQREKRRRKHQKFKEDLMKLSKPVLYRAKMVLRGHPGIDANQYLEEVENYICPDESLGSQSNDRTPISTLKEVDGHALVNINALRLGQNEESDVFLPARLAASGKEVTVGEKTASVNDDCNSQTNITAGTGGNSISGHSIKKEQKVKITPKEANDKMTLEFPRLKEARYESRLKVPRYECRHAPLPAIRVAETVSRHVPLPAIGVTEKVSRETLVDEHQMISDTFNNTSRSPALVIDQRQGTSTTSSKLYKQPSKNTNASYKRNMLSSSKNTDVSNTSKDSITSNSRNILSSSKSTDVSNSSKDSITSNSRNRVSSISPNDKKRNTSSRSSISMSNNENVVFSYRNNNEIHDNNTDRVTASKNRSANSITANNNRNSDINNSITADNNRNSDINNSITASSNRDINNITTRNNNITVNNNSIMVSNNSIPTANHSITTSNITTANNNTTTTFINRKSSKSYRNKSHRVTYNNIDSNNESNNRSAHNTYSNSSHNKILKRSKSINTARSINISSTFTNNSAKTANCYNKNINNTSDSNSTIAISKYNDANNVPDSNKTNATPNDSNTDNTPNDNNTNSALSKNTFKETTNNAHNRSIALNINTNSTPNNKNTNNNSTNNNTNNTPKSNTNNNSNNSSTNNKLSSITNNIPNNNTNNTLNNNNTQNTLSSNTNNTLNNDTTNSTTYNNNTNNTFNIYTPPYNNNTNNTSNVNSWSTDISSSRTASRISNVRKNSTSSKYMFWPSASVSQVIPEEDDVTVSSSPEHNKHHLKINSCQEQDCTSNNDLHNGLEADGEQNVREVTQGMPQPWQQSEKQLKGLILLKLSASVLVRKQRLSKISRSM